MSKMVTISSGELKEVQDRLTEVEKTLQRMEAMLSSMHKHEEWLGRLRKRLNSNRVVDEEGEADLLGAVGSLVLYSLQANTYVRRGLR